MKTDSLASTRHHLGTWRGSRASSELEERRKKAFGKPNRGALLFGGSVGLGPYHLAKGYAHLYHRPGGGEKGRGDTARERMRIGKVPPLYLCLGGYSDFGFFVSFSLKLFSQCLLPCGGGDRANALGRAHLQGEHMDCI